MVSAMLGCYPGAQTQQQITMGVSRGLAGFVWLYAGVEGFRERDGQRNGQGLAG